MTKGTRYHTAALGHQAAQVTEAAQAPTPETDRVVEWDMRDHARRLERQRDDLLAALKGTLYLFEGHAVSKTDIEQIAFARAAIAKATGEQP